MSKSEIKWFECPHDNYKTKEKEHLISHIVNKHMIYKVRSLYGCPLCDYTSNSEDYVMDHILYDHIKKRIKHLWKKFLCRKCDFESENFDDFKNHYIISHYDIL